MKNRLTRLISRSISRLLRYLLVSKKNDESFPLRTACNHAFVIRSRLVILFENGLVSFLALRDAATFYLPSVSVVATFPRFCSNARKPSSNSAIAFAFHLPSFNTDFGLARGSFLPDSRSQTRIFERSSRRWNLLRKTNLIFRRAWLVAQLKLVQKRYSNFVKTKNSKHQ